MNVYRRSIPLGENKVLQIMILAFTALWALLAVSPVNRTQWLIENILVVLLIAALAVTFKKFPFSTSSYVLIFVFLCLHLYAAHYTYESTPVDMWLKSAIHTHRSYYDRLVHFAFGLLWIYPFRELLTRTNGKGRFWWTMTIPAAYILSLGTVFEIVEMLAALIGGQAGQDYAGLQGDPFDSIKDLSMTLIGAAIASPWIALRKRKERRS